MYLELNMTNILVINENIKCPICRSISQISKSSEIHDDFDCPICLDNIMVESNISIYKLSCNHYFCMECINKYIENNKKYNQPIIINNTNFINNNISECILIFGIFSMGIIYFYCGLLFISYMGY
jgi:transposase-like protein